MRLLEKINYMALSYFGHIARRENNCLEKVLLQGKIEGSRRPGRPKAKWTDRIKSLVGQPLSTVYQLAADRNKWSSLMKVTNCQSRQIRSKQARYTTLWQPRPHGDSRPPSCAHSHPGIGHLHVPNFGTRMQMSSLSDVVRTILFGILDTRHNSLLPLNWDPVTELKERRFLTMNDSVDDM